MEIWVTGWTVLLVATTAGVLWSVSTLGSST